MATEATSATVVNRRADTRPEIFGQQTDPTAQAMAAEEKQML